MLGDSFLFRVARALRACLSETAPTGHAQFRRSPVQGVDHSPPTAAAMVGASRLSAAVRRSRVLAPTVVRVHPVVPLIWPTCFQFFTRFDLAEIGLPSARRQAPVSLVSRDPPGARRSGVRERENGDHPRPGSLQDTHRFGGGRAGGDDVVDHKHVRPCQPLRAGAGGPDLRRSAVAPRWTAPPSRGPGPSSAAPGRRSRRDRPMSRPAPSG